MTTDTRGSGGAWGGWLMFAATLLVAVGFINAIQGIAALVKDDVYLVTQNGLLVTADYTAWGWTLLIWGIIVALAGVSLFAARGWARWFAIVVVGLNLIMQFAWFPAYPLWSLVAIGLDTLVLFTLTVRWEDAKAGLSE